MRKLLGKVKNTIKNLISRFKALSFKRKIIVIIVIILVLFFGIRAVRGPAKPGYTSAKVSRENIVETVSETGSVAVNGKIDVYSPTIGYIEDILVGNNESVKEGDELFTVKSSADEQEKQAAYSTYLTAVSALNSAKSTQDTLRSGMYSAWDDYRSLATNGTYENGDGSPNKTNREATEFQTAQDDWQAAEAQYKDQSKVISQAQAEVTSAKLLYDATQDAVVKAPISGTISNVAVTKGSTVGIKSLTVTTQPVLTVSTNVAPEIAVSFSESDIAKVKVGQEVVADVSAIDDKVFKGIVKRVDGIGTTVDGVIRYNVYIEILTKDDRLRPGMTVDVDIITKKVNGVLAVPNSAVKPYQGGKAVRVYDRNEVKYIPVKTGIRGKENTEILQGLELGQEVITALSNEELKRPGLFGN